MGSTATPATPATPATTAVWLQLFVHTILSRADGIGSRQKRLGDNRFCPQPGKLSLLFCIIRVFTFLYTIDSYGNCRIGIQHYWSAKQEQRARDSGNRHIGYRGTFDRSYVLRLLHVNLTFIPCQEKSRHDTGLLKNCTLIRHNKNVNNQRPFRALKAVIECDGDRRYPKKILLFYI